MDAREKGTGKGKGEGEGEAVGMMKTKKEVGEEGRRYLVPPK